MNKYAGNQRGRQQRDWSEFWWRAFQSFLAKEARASDLAAESPQFTTEQVIRFLKLQKERGKLAWQRLQMVDAIAEHRERLAESGSLSFADEGQF